MHLDHALASAAVFLRHHRADETVARDLLVECVGKDTLVCAVHPVLAVELLRDGIAVFENLPLFMREIKVHLSSPARLCAGPGGSPASGPKFAASFLTVVRF